MSSVTGAVHHNRYRAHMMDTKNEEARPFCVRLPADMADALARQAEANDRSRGAELRHLLKSHLKSDATTPERES